jgi:hypothetical protein
MLLWLAARLVPQAWSQLSGESGGPLQIESRDGGQRVGNMASARGDVVISFGDTTIYCDYAQYDHESRNVMLSGDVRIYRGGKIFSGDRAIYNVETKQLSGAEFRTASGPFLAQAHALSAEGRETVEAAGALLTTDDSPDPSFHVNARKVRIYQNDHTEYEDVTVYVGRTPIFWLPYLYQPAKLDQSFSLTPGVRSMWGPFLMTRYMIPLGSNTIGAARVDFLSKRGVGLGFDATRSSTSEGSWGRFRSYYLYDAAPSKIATSDPAKTAGTPVYREKEVSPHRYRLSVQDRSFITDTLYTSININKLSDIKYLQDFAPNELRLDPNPDTVLNITKWHEDFTLSLQYRRQFNQAFEGSGKLPELALDVKRQPLPLPGLFYEGESSIARLSRKFPRDGNFFRDPFFLTHPPTYQYDQTSTTRVDSFHQILFPKTFGGWLSVVPRLGLRATHYTNSVDEKKLAAAPAGQASPADLSGGDALTRVAVNAGVEASVKFSRSFDSVESRSWGLDGLRHVVQPYMNLSVVDSNQDTRRILPTDVLNLSTKLPPIDFPQFNSIDSITSWKILRLGVRNRLLTRRDEATFHWLEMDTFFDTRFQRPTLFSFGGNLPPDYMAADLGKYSNLFQRIRWNPTPWASFWLEGQVPAFDAGFSEVNLTSRFQPHRDVIVGFGNRHISGFNPRNANTASANSAAPASSQFQDSDLLNGLLRLRVSDNWAVGYEENFELRSKQSLFQRFTVERDLRSWVASLSVVSFERGSRSDVSVLFTLSLKDLPQIQLPLHFDPSASASTNNTRNQ